MIFRSDHPIRHLTKREKIKGNYDPFNNGYNSGISACKLALLDSGIINETNT